MDGTTTIDHFISILYDKVVHLSFLLNKEVKSHSRTLQHAANDVRAWEMSHASLSACLEAANSYVLLLETEVY